MRAGYLETLEGPANGWFRPGLDALARADRVVSRGRAVREHLHAVTRLDNPGQRVLAQPFRRWNPFFQIAEPVWILAGSADADWIAAYNGRLRAYLDPGRPTFHGAYGHRLRRATTRDQLRDVLDQLRLDPGSRRACATIHLPERDNPAVETNDRPCNLAASWLLRDGKLAAATFARSNDYILGLPTNLVQFTTVQEFLAAALWAGPGPYTHFSASLHLYEDDPIAARLLGRPLAEQFQLYDYVEPAAMRPWLWPDEGWVAINKLYAGMTLGEDACPYWRTVSGMLQAWRLLREEKLSDAAYAILPLPGQDWAIAGLEYLWRWARRRQRQTELLSALGGMPRELLDYVTHDDGRD